MWLQVAAAMLTQESDWSKRVSDADGGSSIGIAQLGPSDKAACEQLGMRKGSLRDHMWNAECGVLRVFQQVANDLDMGNPQKMTKNKNGRRRYVGLAQTWGPFHFSNQRTVLASMKKAVGEYCVARADELTNVASRQ